MRVLLVALSIVLSLNACSKKTMLIPDTISHEPLVAEESDVVELRLSSEELDSYADKDAEIWEKARTAGLVKAFNKMVNRDIVMMPADGLMPLGAAAGKYVQHGAITDVADEETGDMVQKFSVAARFVADMDLSGRIVVLEEEQYVAGMHEVAYAMLHLALPPQMPAYAVITERIGELSPHIFRLIGLAEIKQVTPYMAVEPEGTKKRTGMLCTLEIMASDREIEANDLIFLLDVDVMALNGEKAQAIAADPETVVVQPLHKDKVHEPKEQK